MKGKKQEENRSYIKRNVGIDVGKDELKVCLSGMTRDFKIETLEQQVFTNDKKGWKSLSRLLKTSTGSEEIESVHCTMEATGVYHEGVAYYLHEQKFVVHVVLANLSKSYGKSLGIKSKTDKIDARTLAQLGLERELREWVPPSTALVNLKQLTRERERLIRTQTVFKNNLHGSEYRAFPNASTKRRTNEIISFIKVQIKSIDNEIETEMPNDETIKRKLPYLLSIPGVGKLTAATIIAETRGFAATVNGKQIASYCGLDVRIAESGTWKGQSRISKKGNSHIRHALYMPTLSKIRFDASTKEHYEKLAERTGSMKAVVAECRKPICLMYSLRTKEEMYAPDYKHGSVDPKPVLPPVDTVAPAVPADLEERKNESADVTEPVTENTVPCTENAEKTASETFLRSVPQSVKTKAPMLPKPLRKTSHCARKTPEKASGDISKPTGKKRKKNVR